MDIDKVRALTDTELVTELATAKRHLYDLRFQLATRQLTDYSQLPHTRRRIARILTVMTERQLSEATVPAFVAVTDSGGNGRAARPKSAAAGAAPEAIDEPAPASRARTRAASTKAAASTKTASKPRARRTSETRTTESRTTRGRAAAQKKEKPAASRRTGTRRAGSTSK
jgi:large subunit ribosomal protein L29